MSCWKALSANCGEWGDGMKIRIMGTSEECKKMQALFNSMSVLDGVQSVSVSDLYPNRNSTNVYRVYIDITGSVELKGFGEVTE